MGWARLEVSGVSATDDRLRADVCVQAEHVVRVVCSLECDEPLVLGVSINRLDRSHVRFHSIVYVLPDGRERLERRHCAPAPFLVRLVQRGTLRRSLETKPEGRGP